MAVLDAIRAHGKHRGKSVTDLYADIKRLEAENDQWACAYNKLAADFLMQQDQLDQAGIDLSGAREDKRAAEEKEAEALALAEELTEENAGLRARIANLNPYRETATADAVEQDTEPIDARTLRDDYVDDTRTGWRAVLPVSPVPPLAPASPIEVKALWHRFPVGDRVVTVTGQPRTT